MDHVVLLAHLLGFVLWLGGALAGMVIAAAARGGGADGDTTVTRLQAALTTKLVAPGAVLVLASGLYLTMSRYPGEAMAQASAWLFVMQAAGVIGSLLVLLVSLPTALKISRLPDGSSSTALSLMLRRRLAIIGSFAGTLGFVALLAGALV